MTFREVGGLVKRPSSSGAGLHGSTFPDSSQRHSVPELSARYRILAELIDQGTRSGLLIPVHKPVAPPNPATAATRAAMGVAELDALRSLGINPSHALQHSGYYYYMAAKATDMRRERFLAAVEAEVHSCLA
jgi:hypothetical protein